jgi:hypothetical protein
MLGWLPVPALVGVGILMVYAVLTAITHWRPV